MLDLLPAALLLGVCTLLAGSAISNTNTTRLAILQTLYAYAGCRAMVAATRLLTAPRQPQLRLVPLSDTAAL
ncbi:MAG: hypothetical protein QM753_11625 [Thermomicrobiales bacterium]